MSPWRQALLFLFFQFSQGADPSHLVRNLPGQPSIGFKHYAGLIPVNASGTKELFYWFYEADNSKASTLPLVLWLNGGPGCSSVGAGALTELGPFHVNEDATGLVVNPYSWTKVANVIFLESPAGVGFSYSKTPQASPFSDNQTANENLGFLVEWLKKFPEYKKNDFYVAGESYAGHFIPTLALKVLAYVRAGGSINFKGIAIGNPRTVLKDESFAQVHFLYSHSIIPAEAYNAAVESCFSVKNDSRKCSIANQRISQLTAHIDRYNVYKPACNDGDEAAEALDFVRDPCKKYPALYLNRKSVQAALNLRSRSISWKSCNTALKSDYSAADREASMVPLYEQAVKAGIRIWIYSGDMDTVVPTLSTQSWIQQLNLTIERNWSADGRKCILA